MILIGSWMFDKGDEEENKDFLKYECNQKVGLPFQNLPIIYLLERLVWQPFTVKIDLVSVSGHYMELDNNAQICLK